MSDAIAQAPIAVKPDADLAAAGLAPRPSKAVPIILLVNSLLVAVLLARSFMAPPASPSEHGSPPAAEHAAPGAAPLGFGPTVRMPEFVVHLRNPEAERYAKMTFELEVGVEADRDRVNSAMPKVRELFIAYLSDRTTEDLRGSEGIERTKRDLLARMSQEAPGLPVRAIFITDIVVQ
ncbi:MAG: flagellar basal body-associated FliL family protein [Myxococcales bacterium]|nr:flagellar basal body-associated FliL family protein [Myxococcales bacterium]